MVAKAVLLLVRGVVLLVDDDDAGACERHEYGRARADDDLRLAARRGEPGACTLDLAESRVQRGDVDAEPLAETAQRLRRQRDLRQQHERLLAAREAGGDRGEVDLGLA